MNFEKILWHNKKTTIGKKLFQNFSAVIVISLIITGSMTFFITRYYSAKTFKNTATELLKQNKNYVDLICKNVEGLSLQYISDKDLNEMLSVEGGNEYDKSTNASKIQEKLLNYSSKDSTSMIKSVYLVSENGYSISSISTMIDDEALNKYKKSAVYEKVKSLDGSSLWQAPHKEELSSAGNVVISNIRILKSLTSFKSIGLLQINIDPSIIENSLKSAKIGNSGYIFIVNSDGTVISHKDSKLLGKKYDDSLIKKIKKGEEGSFSYNLNGTSMYGVYATSNATGWKYVCLVPNKEINAGSNYTGYAILIAAIISIILSSFAAFGTSKKIEGSLKDIIGATANLSKGDFTVKLKDSSFNEISELLLNIKSMITSLNKLLGSTKTNVISNGVAANEIMDNISALYESSKQVSSSISEISSSSRQQSEYTVKCSKIAEELSLEIHEAFLSLENSNKEIESTIALINSGFSTILELQDISKNNDTIIDELSNTIAMLKDNTSNILSIASKINEISSKTNIVALNASIEAARAGEAGKSFKVVASEIRNLADEASTSSKTIKSIIETIHVSIENCLNKTKKAKDSSLKESNMVKETYKSFELINNSSESIKCSMKVLNSSMSKIKQGRKLLVSSISDISELSQKNNDFTEEIAATISEEHKNYEELTCLSNKLKDTSGELGKSIEIFKLK